MTSFKLIELFEKFQMFLTNNYQKNGVFSLFYKLKGENIIPK